jgi:MFS family permease
MALPAVIQPVFLKDIIGIPEGLAGSINSGLQNMGQLGTLLFVGMVGIVSDRYGRRILVVVGFILCFFFYTVFAHSREIALLFGIESVGGQVMCVYMIRFIIGMGLVLSHPQFVTMVADYTFAEGRGKGMALHAIMMSLGTLSVYGLFTRLATSIGIVGLLYIAGMLGLLGALVAGSGLVDRLPERRKTKTGIMDIRRAVAKSFPLKISYAAAFITRANITIPSTILIVWMVAVADKFGLTPIQATVKGGIIMMVGSLFSLVSFSLFGVLLDRAGRVPVLITTLLITGIGYLLIATTENPFSNMMFIYICILGFGKNGAMVAANTLASDAAPKPMLGSILGGLNTLGTLGIILFLQASGYLFDNFSSQSPFLVKGAIDFLFGIWVWATRNRILIPHQTE